MMHIGIDNGISGGIVAISAHDGSLIGSIPMPVKLHKKRNEIDIRLVYLWLLKITGENLASAACMIEEPGGSKSNRAAVSMAGSFHSLRALCEVKGLNWRRTTPQAWQKAMLGKCGAGNTKPAALAKAKELWPGETWLASPRCKVAHDGMIDAALLAEFARRNAQ